MKVALVLSGLPRKVVEGYESTWKHVVNTYDTDVYLHGWVDEEWDKIAQVYGTHNVQSLHLQKPFKFTHYKQGISLPHNDTSRPLPQYDVMSCFRQLPMMYSWQIAFRPVIDSQIPYDWVIRSRYDIGIANPINLENLDSNQIHLARLNPMATFYDDNLCIANLKNSTLLFSDIFTRLIAHARTVGVLQNAESSWNTMVQSVGLSPFVHLDLNLRFRLLRDNWLWWGDANGNIITEKVLT